MADDTDADRLARMEVMLRQHQGVLAAMSRGVADLGDVEITPANAERTLGQIAERLEPVVRSGTRTLCLGGEHTIVLGELRAHAAVHGPLGLVLLDAHADVWDRYVGERYYHGSPFRRALEEGLLDPSRSLLAGMRGSLYGPDDAAMPDELGFETIPCEELVSLSHEEYGARVRRRVGDGPLFLSFDIDVLDPAFAPGTGTPEVGGLSTREALGFVRALRGHRFSGYDVVEVSPAYAGRVRAAAAAGARRAAPRRSGGRRPAPPGGSWRRAGWRRGRRSTPPRRSHRGRARPPDRACRQRRRRCAAPGRNSRGGSARCTGTASPRRSPRGDRPASTGRTRSRAPATRAGPPA